MSDQRFLIRTYEPGDEHGILDLFNAVFAEDDESYEPRDLARWNWEFRDNPAGHQIVLGLEADTGRIVCQYCCLPYFVNLRGEKTVAGCGVDSFLHPDLRQGLKREGIWLRVARTYFRELAKLPHTSWGYGYPNEKAYRVGVRLLKYHEVRKPQTALVRDLAGASDDADVGGKVSAHLDFEEITHFDARFDRLWDELRPHYPMATWRNAEYLNWRYVAPPGVPYRRFAARDASGDVRGFVVVRPDWQDAAILCVPEIFCHPDDDGAFSDLLRGVVEFGRRTAQGRIETWLPESSPQFTLAAKMGLTPEPSLFNLVGRFYRDDLDLEYARGNWFYTLGDMDVL